MYLSKHRPNLCHDIVDAQIGYRCGVNEAGHEIALGLDERHRLGRRANSERMRVRRQFDVAIDAQ
jgi:hypothetical protein